MAISVRSVSELKAVVLAFRALPNTLRTEINRQTRAQVGPIWTGEVNAKLRTPMDRLVLGAGVRVKAGNPPVLQAATSTRGIGKTRRLRPADEWPAFELGANRNKVETYERRTKHGQQTSVTRHTARQLPTRIRKGRVVFPAAAEAIPRITSLWVQTVVRAIWDASEGKRS